MLRAIAQTPALGRVATMSGTVLQRQTLQAGDRIFKEGDEGNVAYVVQSGEVEIFRDIDGKEVVLGRVGKGGIFGEMALIDSKPRMAGARASKGSTIIIVTHEMLDQKLNKADPFVRGLLNILVNNIRTMTK
jgi:CRP/FNR family transcriptional regulator, cyclic AMP receptor protein